MKKETNSEQITSDMKIIDLDKVDTETSIDYDKFAQEDSLQMDEKSAPPDYRPQKTGIIDRVLKINWHVILLLVLVFSTVFIIYRIKNWGTKVDLDNLGIIDNTDYDVEITDNILPNYYEGTSPADDGETYVVMFGNDTLAQNRGTSDDMANRIAELTDATVYNCAVTGSFLTATNYFLDPENAPMDAFSLYWLTTSYAMDEQNKQLINDMYLEIVNEHNDKLSSDAKVAYETLAAIDFNKVDVIAIMYDARDYLAGKPISNETDPKDILTYSGNLEASIELIKGTYPHIRIIIMSPTYAYALNAEGDYVSSDLYYYLDHWKLSDYALIMGNLSNKHAITFVDNIYGTVNELNADQYLLDHINLNVAGREKLAERFVYALEYYDEK